MTIYQKPFWVIASYSFRELMRSRLFYIVLAIAIVLSLLTFVVTELTYGTSARIALDMGLALVSLSGYGLAFFAGLPLISQEEESRTIYLIISRPVKRAEFYLGKLLGVSGFMALNFFSIFAVMFTTVNFLGATWPTLAYWAILFSLMECLLLLTFIVLFTLVMSRPLALVAGIGILVFGHAVGETLQIKFVQDNPIISTFLKLIELIFPLFQKFNLKQHILYQSSIELSYLLVTSFYWIGWLSFSLILGIMIMNRRDFN
jgi:ABC-type transport system involved in multi-copper enzyme maturation permease subunit